MRRLIRGKVQIMAKKVLLVEDETQIVIDLVFRVLIG